MQELLLHQRLAIVFVNAKACKKIWGVGRRKQETVVHFSIRDSGAEKKELAKATGTIEAIAPAAFLSTVAMPFLWNNWKTLISSSYDLIESSEMIF